MPTYTTYSLNQHPEHTAKILESIPKTWSYINSLLFAPKELYRTGKVAYNSRLKLSCNYLFSPLIIASLDDSFEEHDPSTPQPDYYKEPNLIGIIHEHLMPSSIEYIEAGRNPLNFEIAKNILTPYIRMGYKGTTECILGDDTPRAKIEINHYTKTIDLIVYTEHRGQERLIEQIERTIKKLDLKSRGARTITFPTPISS